MKTFYAFLLLVSIGITTGCSQRFASVEHSASQSKSERPIVIAHRGASGYLPEHTTQALILAFMQGADFIEQDLVATKDHQLVVLHDIHIDTVTNVKEVFPKRVRADGRFYAIDFTLAELKQLRVHERTSLEGQQVYPKRYRAEGDFRVATLHEQLDMIDALNRYFGRSVGVYPEIKAPGWHRMQGADISRLTVDVLRQRGLNNKTANIFVQCFDFAENKRLRTELGLKTKLIQLLADNSWNESSTDYSYLMSAVGLTELAQYVDGVGPWVPMLIDTKSGELTPFTARLRQHNLAIHPYTFRADSPFEGMHNSTLLNTLFNDVGIDGIFSDHPDVVSKFLDER